MGAEEKGQWQRMRFKRNKVWLEMDAAGKPLVKDGKVRIKFQLDQPHEYWVPPSAVTPVPKDDEQKAGARSASPSKPAVKPAAKKKTVSKLPDTDQCRNAICIYTDGACSGNPGPAGIGVVMRYKDDYKEISRFIGEATNNIAELEAIRTALAAVKNRRMPVIIFTDSSYALGLLSKGWKAKQNQELVGDIRRLMTGFASLQFVKVKGHAGHPENERADRLAVGALNDRS